MSDSDQQWKNFLSEAKLLENEIHVWRAFLNVSVSVLHTLQKTLEEEEAIKAGQFYFEKDRHRFIVAHGVLRTLLSRYLNADPGQFRFDYNIYGKPSLGFPFSESKLNFNISHSHEVALYAFTYARQVGVDVEYMRSDVDYEQLVRQSFSSREQGVFHALPQSLKRQVFFNGWTRKEAYIKARGRGLSLPLDLFDVSLRPGDPPMLLKSREDTQETTRWSLQELFPGSSYAGALAAEGSEWTLSCWQYS